MYILVEGIITPEVYEKKCRDKRLDPHKKNVVFLFPGNSGHHLPNTTLFSIKDGANLAALSGRLGKLGVPTLSLPTTTMEDFSHDLKQQRIVQQAVCDLYRALACGYHFMLPVRIHRGTTYFNNPLSDTNLEPSFWGGVQQTNNKELSDFYLVQLNKFFIFNQLSEAERQKEIAANPNDIYYKAYQEVRTNPEQFTSWFKPLTKAEPMKTAKTLPTIPFDRFPTSYVGFYKPNQSTLQSARDLLNDYTKNNSALSRFFHGHWNRHHVAEVHALVQKIDKKEIKDINTLLIDLMRIKLVNIQGSLAKRITFIERLSIIEIASSKESSLKMN